MGTGKPTEVKAEVKSATESKINWTNAIGLVASLLTLFSGGAIEISPEMQATILGVISVITPVITIIMRTFFTKSVVVNSVTK